MFPFSFYSPISLALGPLETPTLFVSRLLAPLQASTLLCRTFTSTELTTNFLALAAAPFDTFLCHFLILLFWCSVYS